MQSRQPNVTAPVSATTTVIGPRYCAPYPIELAVVGTLKTSADKFSVKDFNGNTVFKLTRPPVSLHRRRVLLDAAGHPVVTLHRKIMTAHDRWLVFRGESTERSDLLFSVKRPNIFQLETKLEVFLANNTTENVCDFKVEGSWSERSCYVYAVQSLNIVAQMHKRYAVQSTAFEKDCFMVRVETDIDYAFIVALILILDEVNIVKRQAWS